MILRNKTYIIKIPINDIIGWRFIIHKKPHLLGEA